MYASMPSPDLDEWCDVGGDVYIPSALQTILSATRSPSCKCVSCHNRVILLTFITGGIDC